MKLPQLDEGLVLGPQCSLRQVIEHIDRNRRGAVMVMDGRGRLLDLVTDGDVRRALLAGSDLDAPVTELASRRDGSAYAVPLTAPSDGEPDALLATMRAHGIRQLPLVDEQGQVVSMVALEDLVPDTAIGLQALIMAGGRGTRLRPLTDSVPKPMLPVGDRPLLEHTIERLRSAGVSRVHIATHYRSEQITRHFGDGRRFGVDVRYLSEAHALGTAGSLSNLAADEPILVMNGDVLTNLDVRAMLQFHREQSAELSVASRPYRVEVPFGVLECQGGLVRGIAEKPEYRFLVNAGVYLLQPEALGFVPRDRASDMTDLVEVLIAAKRRVVNFPLHEYWLDVGRPGDYARAQEDARQGRLRP